MRNVAGGELKGEMVAIGFLQNGCPLGGRRVVVVEEFYYLCCMLMTKQLGYVASENLAKMSPKMQLKNKFIYRDM